LNEEIYYDNTSNCNCSSVGAFMRTNTRNHSGGPNGLNYIVGFGSHRKWGGSFTGKLTITGFSVINGVLNATGTLSGTLTDALGNVINTVTNLPVSIPLAGVSGSCQILALTLGPLDLNLLGLMVHLNQVVLNITAQSGPGNLLGNLLCVVSHLLDSNGSLTALSTLLNQILGAL
jgi:hypothetical protein